MGQFHIIVDEIYKPVVKAVAKKKKMKIGGFIESLIESDKECKKMLEGGIDG